MALKICPKCKAKVTSEALVCHHCGAPLWPTHTPRRFGFEWKSAQTFFGYPLIHIAFGTNSQGKVQVAKGIIAIGQFAVGLITVAQFGVGLLLGLGQFILAPVAVGQFAGGLVVGVGQLATGIIAHGQFVAGYYAAGEFDLIRLGKFLWMHLTTRG